MNDPQKVINPKDLSLCLRKFKTCISVIVQLIIIFTILWQHKNCRSILRGRGGGCCRGGGGGGINVSRTHAVLTSGYNHFPPNLHPTLSFSAQNWQLLHYRPVIQVLYFDCIPRNSESVDHLFTVAESLMNYLQTRSKKLVVYTKTELKLLLQCCYFTYRSLVGRLDLAMIFITRVFNQQS